MKINNEIIETIENHFRNKLNLFGVKNENIYFSKEDIKRLKAERSRLKEILRIVGTEDSEIYERLLNQVERKLSICQKQ